MNKEPETYEELIRQKRCVDLTNYYELTNSELEQIYNFLENNPSGKVIGGMDNISLKVDEKITLVIPSKCKTTQIDGLTMDNIAFTIIPHYTPSSSYSSSGGSSSNNNNNNNNNNNR